MKIITYSFVLLLVLVNIFIINKRYTLNESILPLIKDRDDLKSEIKNNPIKKDIYETKKEQINKQFVYISIYSGVLLLSIIFMIFMGPLDPQKLTILISKISILCNGVLSDNKITNILSRVCLLVIPVLVFILLILSTVAASKYIPSIIIRLFVYSLVYYIIFIMVKGLVDPAIQMYKNKKKDGDFITKNKIEIYIYLWLLFVIIMLLSFKKKIFSIFLVMIIVAYIGIVYINNKSDFTKLLLDNNIEIDIVPLVIMICLLIKVLIKTPEEFIKDSINYIAPN